LKNLKKLDASHNRITTLAGISSLKLEHLDISHNSLSSEDSLSILQLAGDTLK
jgi:Leucine-rich repeat (LRR) protein